MAMSLKQEIETWVQALAHYDNNEFEESLKTFDIITDTSKILFNCGVIHATLGEHDKAVECYQRAIQQDNYLAVAFFQQGVSNFLVGDFEEALANFNDALYYLRGNQCIDYEQLGLKFKLHSCEVLFNRGLCYIYLQQKDAGMGDLLYAAKEKATPAHDVIDEAIREKAEGYTVFSIPVGVVYRPNSAKIKNLKARDYLGKARLIASSEQPRPNIGTTKSEAKRINIAKLKINLDDRPPESISFAASNLVHPYLHSRSRQQSEPPVNRTIFPPTPPPDTDKPTFSPPKASPPRPSHSTNSETLTRSPPNRPERLDLTKERPRLGTVRTASEPRPPPLRNDSYSSTRSRREPPPSRGRLFMETTPMRPDNGGEADIDEYPEELYNLQYNPHSGSHHHHHDRKADSRTRQRSQSHQRISNPVTDSPTSSLSDFELLHGNAGGNLSRPRRPSQSTQPRPLSMKNIRVKVHCGDDTRYIMVGMTMVFEEFVDKVKEKFNLKAKFKIKIRDEGDLITMGDRDDWDMGCQSVGKEARREGVELGKMEVWVIEVAGGV